MIETRRLPRNGVAANVRCNHLKFLCGRVGLDRVAAHAKPRDVAKGVTARAINAVDRWSAAMAASHLRFVVELAVAALAVCRQVIHEREKLWIKHYTSDLRAPAGARQSCPHLLCRDTKVFHNACKPRSGVCLGSGALFGADLRPLHVFTFSCAFLFEISVAILCCGCARFVRMIFAVLASFLFALLSVFRIVSCLGRSCFCSFIVNHTQECVACP